MGLDGPTSRFLGRLEAEVDRTLGRRVQVVMAFSGGLGSLVVATLVRKRCDLLCAVSGLESSPDVEAAVLAERILDFRLETLRLTARSCRSLAQSVHRRLPHLGAKDVLSLVPLAAVRRRHPDASVLAGFDASARSASFLGGATAFSLVSPLRRTSARGTVPRTRLLAIARRLGIPDAFARVSSRDPEVGSGVAPALRALSKEEGASVEGLLGIHDYQ